MQALTEFTISGILYPVAVINSSVAGVYATAKKLGVKKVYDMVHGIQGFK
jgi:hypothetical protein